MKHIIASTILVVASMAASAAPAKIFEDHEETWYVHTETFGRLKEGVSVLISKQYKDTNKTIRFYLGAEYESCKKGFGELHIKEAPRGEWQPLTMFTKGGTTIGDNVADILCSFASTKAKTKSIDI